jgi:hypothetical protein
VARGRVWLTAVAVAALPAAVLATGTACDSDGATNGTSDTGAAASCAAPRLTASPDAVRAGGTLTIKGRWFVSECYDTSVQGQSRPPNPPIASVRLVLRTTQRQVFDLAVAHPDQQGSFTMLVTVPSGAATGRATVATRNDLANRVEVAITR